MSELVQKSTLRGNYRKPISTLSTSDVHGQIVFDRPDPIKIGWSIYDINQFGPFTSLPLTGYGPGSQYYVIPSPGAVSFGNAITQIWLNTNIPQPAGIGNWVLVSQLIQGSTQSSSGGSGDGGAGGGDGGDG